MSEKIEKNLVEVATIARKILELGPICDSCLGRQFAMLSTGLSNSERGKAIKIFLAMTGSIEGGKPLLEELALSSKNARMSLGKGEPETPETCWVCLGEMEPERLDRWAEMAIRETRHFQHDTFLVGTKISGLLAENEEILLTDGGSKYAEPMKSEMNREVGKRIAEKTGKDVAFDSPHVLSILNLAEESVELQIVSLYILGRYRKLARGFPQTRWPCRDCGGSGCEACNYTGRRYQESVDELIRDPIIEATRCEDTVFHGSGREDIDAKMLGTGRPFVVEAVSPAIREVDLSKLQEEINQRAAGKVEVLDLVITKKGTVEHLKKAALDKTYTMRVDFGQEISEEKLKSVLSGLVGLIEQRTPNRVSHRRADKVRTKEVYSVKLDGVAGKRAKITIEGSSGLYVKELISGDEGRTNPSLAGLLSMDAKVAELDVIKVGGEADAQVTRNTETYQR